MERWATLLCSELVVEAILKDLDFDVSVWDRWECVREFCRNVCSILGVWHGTAPLAAMWMAITRAQLGHNDSMSLKQAMSLKISLCGMAPGQTSEGFMSLTNLPSFRRRHFKGEAQYVLRMLESFQLKRDAANPEIASLLESCTLIARDVSLIL